MRIFLLILAFVESLNRQDYCNFYVEMVSFVNLANEYLSKYDELTEDQKKRYQRSLHEILKRMSHNQTYIIGGKWGESWTLPKLYAFYQAVIFDLKQNPFPGNNGVGKRYDLPAFSYSPLSDPHIREKIHDELFGICFHLPDEMSRTFQIILKSGSKSEPLNVPPPVVSPLFVDSSANWTDLGAAISALNFANSLATPRDTVVISPTAFDDSTPVGVISTHREICTPCALCTPSTPRTPRLPGFSKWLLQALLSQEFLQFLQQQSHQSSSQQLKQMFRVMQMFFTQYRVELFDYQNPQTIHSFYQALNEYPFVKIALELYHGKPLDGWMDIRIVSESNEEDQKRFYEYLKMMIHLKVWLCDDAEKEDFSAECDGKRLVFDELNNSFDIFYLLKPSTIGEQPPMA
jgi:hypothetical protein